MGRYTHRKGYCSLFSFRGWFYSQLFIQEHRASACAAYSARKENQKRMLTRKSGQNLWRWEYSVRLGSR